jgi:DNA-binding response OmpR family regulator
VTRVLILDRDPDIRRLLLSILEPAGFTVPAGGTTAGMLADADQADAVILDVSSLGRRPTAQVHHLLRTDARTTWLPVLAVGWHATGQDVGIGPATGTSYYLARPFTAAVLLSRLSHLIVHAAITSAALAGLTGSIHTGRLPPLDGQVPPARVAPSGRLRRLPVADHPAAGTPG